MNLQLTDLVNAMTGEQLLKLLKELDVYPVGAVDSSLEALRDSVRCVVEDVLIDFGNEKELESIMQKIIDGERKEGV